MVTDPGPGNTQGTQGPSSVSTKRARIAELARSQPELVFTALNHHLDLDWMREAYARTRKDGATGIDGQTAEAYAENLEVNLRDLLERLKSGRYHAPPVRRTFIPKADGTRRPLGIPTFEDKVAQRAVVMLLEGIYEQDFMDCSFGFRPGRSAHDALHLLRAQIMDRGGRWVLDVDVSKYFDTIDHGHLRGFLDHRVKDGVVRRLIDKWLNAGVLDDGQLRRSELGTPQGGVISPLLANVFLHYVLDQWFAEAVLPRMKRRCSLVRYADDFVMVFEDYLDSTRVLEVLGKRLGKYGLTLHPTKTRRVDFRFKRPTKERHSLTQATTFDFLGFTHVWGKSRNGKAVICQKTAKTRYARAVASINQWCRENRHRLLAAQHVELNRKLLGHYVYYGLTGNFRRLQWFRHRAERIWFYWLRKRTRGGKGVRGMSMERLFKRYPLQPPRIYHRYTVISETVP